MAVEQEKSLVLNDTMNLVVDVLWERPDVPFERLKEIAAGVAGSTDIEATRRRILAMADATPVEAV